VLGSGGSVSVGFIKAERPVRWVSLNLKRYLPSEVHPCCAGKFFIKRMFLPRAPLSTPDMSARCIILFSRGGLFFIMWDAGFSMILWEMATMTKPFEMMGREQFLKEVVSSCCSANGGTLSTFALHLCSPTEVKPLYLLQGCYTEIQHAAHPS